MKEKKGLRNCHSLEESKEKQQLNACGILGRILKQKRVLVEVYGMVNGIVSTLIF